MSQVLGMLPGMSKLPIAGDEVDAQLPKIEAMIRSMTAQERNNPAVIKGSRRARIARGSGTTSPGRQQTREAVRRRPQDDEDDVGRQRWAAAPPQGLQAPTRSGHLTC